MKIGLLSDTHGFLDPAIFDYLKDCDEIWHAGDIGSVSVIEALQHFKPLRAVHGNIDDKEMQVRFPEDLRFVEEKVSVWITHIGGVPPKYTSRVKKKLMEEPPDIFICGHSHVLRVARDSSMKNMLFVNPGAAGNHGFHPVKTVIRFEINDGKIEKMEAIELGKRGAIA